MKVTVTYIIFCITIIFLCFESYADNKLPKSSDPFIITSDSLEVFTKMGKADFKGNVEAKRKDFTLRCNNLEAYYNKEGIVEKLLCKENVVIVQKDRIITGNNALYEQDKSRVTLTGKPEIKQSENLVKGKIIYFYVDDDRVEVLQAKARLKVDENLDKKKGQHSVGISANKK